MAEDVYAVPDLTKKVRYRREREQETEDRGEREERVVDIYVSADDLNAGPGQGQGQGQGPGPQQHPVQQNAAPAQPAASDKSRKNKAFKAATVCLGVLCVILLAGITGLGVRNSKLITENNNLTKDLDIITAEKVQIQSSYDQIQSSYDQLQSKYNNLTKDQDQLQSKYDALTNQKDQIQSNYDLVTAERDELKRRICELSGWRTFGSSYYISTEYKTWTESWQWCRDNQADLIIINNKEEQDFVERLVNGGRSVWLGLTDSEEEGVWKWIDEKPLTSPTYWYTARGQPDDYGGGEDCAVYSSGSDSGWWDEPCTNYRQWMCEKAV